MQSRYPELAPLGIIAAILVLIPLPRQIRARNVATIAMIFWFFEHCLVSGVNAIVWAGNVNDSAPAWCEISEAFCVIFYRRALIEDMRSAMYLRNGEYIAFPAATLCICKHLEYASSGRPIHLDKRQWRRACFELFMCVVLPGLWMLLCKSNGLPCVQILLTLSAQSIASNPYATLSPRILDVPLGIGHHMLQLSPFTFHR
jgi:Pheromone A receptor